MRHILLPFGLMVCGHAALADTPLVVTDIYPVHALVTTVMGDQGVPELLLPAGGDPHDFQLRPSQARALADAGLVVWVGAELTPWLARGLDGVGAKGARLALLEAGGTVTRAFGDTAEEHAEEGHSGHDPAKKEEHADHDHAKKEEHADHDHSGVDPHAWLDPENGRVWLGLIADALADLDPDGAAVYRANAVAGQMQIDVAEVQVRAILAPVKDRPFAVLHDAYGYFSDHFGLTVVGAVRMGDAAQPGAAHLRELQAQLQATGAVCIFPEAGHDKAAVAQLAEAAGVRMGPALAPEGAAGGGDYAALLVSMATDIAGCLADR
jgi:zinc transport system substrate-binding protein